VTAASAAADMFVLGLPADFYQGLPGRIEAITADAVTAALHQVLDPAALRIVAVGDRSRIVDQLARATGTTPVVVDATGN
jgi:zinc protease